MNSIMSKYAKLLVNYSLNIQPGEQLLIKSTILAEPLIREVYRETLKAGGMPPEVILEFREAERLFLDNAEGEQLEYVSPFFQHAVENFDAYLYIRAPYNLRDLQTVNTVKRKIAKNAQGEVMKTYFKRTATRSLKRNLCQYPTIANAQEAGLSLEEYQKFIFNSCFLYEDDPIQSWLDVRKHQQQIVDLLNTREKVQYKGNDIDITFSTKGRTWINSDGQTNMPSGEVYTSPVEDSVNGVIRFTYPALYMGQEVRDVTLYVKDGEVYKWEAAKGMDLLNEVFQIDGTRRFGEAAIGTNHNISQFTKNILFDEKIGGTVHMAVGQAYLQTGGLNQSTIHWDMIADMMNGGEIYADDELIYRDGKFLFVEY